MKKITLLLIVALAALGARAQEISNGDAFFDGWNYYTAEVRLSGVVHFFDDESDADFTIQKVGSQPGLYKLIPERQADDPKFGCQWGDRVQLINKDNVCCLAFYPEGSAISCVIPRAVGSRDDSEEYQQGLWGMALDEVVTGKLLNSAYVGGLTRNNIEQALDVLNAKSSLTPLENVNKQVLTYALAHVDDESDGGRFIDDDFDGDTDDMPMAGDRAAWHASTAADVISGITNNMVVAINGYQPMNLSEVLNRPSLFDGIEGRAYLGEDEEIDDWETPLVISKEVYEGRELIIKNISGLTLRGEKGAHLVVDAAYANVLSFENCDNLRIENLTLGHAVEKGFCVGGVINLRYCSNVEIVNCDMYGCGTYGIEAQNCSDITVENSVIRDCSYGATELFDVDDVQFVDCDIVRNGEGDGSTVTVVPGNNVSFVRCRFAQNNNSHLFMLNQPVTLTDCDVHYVNSLCNYTSLVQGTATCNQDNAPLPTRAIGPK